MTTWWYEEAGDRIGPIDVEELRALVVNGRLSRETLVWRPGMETWRPLSGIKALRALWLPLLPSTVAGNVPTPEPARAPAASEPLAPSALNSGTDSTPANAEVHAAKAVRSRTWVAAGKWQRLLARTFDVSWECALVGCALSALAGHLSVVFGLATASDIVELSQQPGNLVLFGLACFPLTLAFDAGIYKVFGNTPGKALLGLRVIYLNGKPLDFLAYAQRNFRLWFSGYALGIPFICLLTMVWQASRLDRGKPASYDVAAWHRVKARPVSGLNWVALVCLIPALWASSSIVAALGISIALRAPAATATQTPVVASTPAAASTTPAINPGEGKIGGIFWENPLTHKTVLLEPNWTPTAQTDAKGRPVTVFRESSKHVVMQLTQDPVTPGSLSAYAKAYQKNVARDVQFNGTGYPVYHKGKPAWVMHGSPVRDASQEIRVEFAQRGGRIWCLASVSSRGDVDATSMLNKLRETVKESIR